MELSFNNESSSFHELFSNYQLSNHLQVAFKSYLKDVYRDLIRRSEQYGTGNKGVTKIVLSNYLNLSMFVCGKIQLGLNEYLKIPINESNFVEGLSSLYMGPLENTKRIVFKILNFAGDGILKLEDITLFINHLNYENGTGIEIISNSEKYVNDFFEKLQPDQEMTYENFAKILENDSSDIFMLILLCFYKKQPFTNQSIEFYKQRKELEGHKMSIKLEDSEMEEKIFPPSNEIYEIVSLGEFRRNNCQTKCNTGTYYSTANSYNTVSTKASSTMQKIQCTQECVYKEEYLTESNTDEQEFDKIVYRINYQQKFKKCRIIKVNNDLYTFKTTSNKENTQIIFDEIFPLTGYFICELPQVQMNKHEYYPFALINKYSNSIANVQSIFFFDDKEEMRSSVAHLNRKMGQPQTSEFYKKYKLTSVSLGKGAYGEVYLGIVRDDDTERKVAIKVIKKDSLSVKVYEMIKWEIDILTFLKLLNHPNLLNLVDIAEDVDDIFIVTEYINGGNLQTVTNNTPQLISCEDIKEIGYQIITSLSYLHKFGIIHSDFKAENVMLSIPSSKYSKAKIIVIDFGLSQVVSKYEEVEHSSSSLINSPPEVIQNKKFTNKVDIWGLGIVLYKLITGSHPFQSHSDHQIIQSICKGKIVFPNYIVEKCGGELLSLIISCLEKNPFKRPGIEDIINTIWPYK